jgi:hypothetical protein
VFGFGRVKKLIMTGRLLHGLFENRSEVHQGNDEPKYRLPDAPIFAWEGVEVAARG